jgi:hypothetical protein
MKNNIKKKKKVKEKANYFLVFLLLLPFLLFKLDIIK